jgi:hypothetical protein
MTDLQDQILDRLVGAKIGKTWTDGVLTIAATVLDPRMKVAGGGERHRQKQMANILGYPLILCEAIQGASSVLPDEEERRRLGIAVIGAVNPPGGPMKRISGPVALAATAEAALAAHLLVCTGPCPLREAVVAMMAAVQRGDKKIPDPLRGRPKARCPAYKGSEDDLLVPSSPPEQRAVVAFRHLVTACHDRSPGRACSDSARESARVVALKTGVDAAIKLCVKMARQFGL